MAPEVFVEEVSPKTDVWSMGVVVYELLCGVRPFKGENPMALYAVLKRKNVDLTPIHDLGYDEASRFIEFVLVKDESKRPTASSCLGHLWLAHVGEVCLPSGRQAR